jgi:N-acetylglucosaminyl-diphospho-decaprenol L-rhamnosyltransferase
MTPVIGGIAGPVTILPEGPTSGDAQTGITTVVITRDRRDELAHTLRRLQDLPDRTEVIVVDNGSNDGTVAMVRRDFPAVRLLPLGTNLGAAGRNVGVALCVTPFVAFCDDDTWWSPGSLSLAAGLLREHPTLALVTARILVEPGGTTDAISREMGRSPLHRRRGLPGAPLLSFLAGASVVRRRAFLAAGGFNPMLLIGGEEELLGADLADAGWDMAYVADLEVHHRASTQRDPHLRRRQGIRNTLWFTWLRRSPRPAASRSASLLGGLPKDRHSLRAVLQALGGALWVAGSRRPVAADVEAGLQLLDADHVRSEARRYVS